MIEPLPEISGIPDPPSKKSVSLFRKRWRKFRSLTRGYYSFLVVLAAYLASFALPLLINDTALVVRYDGTLHFPILRYYGAQDFGQPGFGEPNYRDLRESFETSGTGDWVLMPPYPYSPTESVLDRPGSPPYPPSSISWFGSDNRGRDVFARLVYGFNISLTFALLVLMFAYTIGIGLGAVLGYFGGKIDILGQRGIEVWSSLPFLYTIIIVSSILVPVYVPGRNQILQPSFWLLIVVLAVFEWVGITYYVRGEFYREKVRDYVGAALAIGASESSIMFRHILPNALTSVISFAPFALVANVSALVALDFLGFGLPAPTPSWGELINQGMNNLTRWWLVFFPLGAVFLTLILIVFIGEAVREAFDPKEYSRLR